MDSFEAGIVGALPMLKRYARRLYRDAEQAEEAVQDVAVRALRSRTRFDPATNLNAWLGTLMINEFRNKCDKARVRRGMKYTDDPNYADSMRAPDNPERALIVMEQYDALGRVPEGRREAMVMSGLGFSCEQIAEEMGVTLRAAYQRVWRGRETLRGLTGGLE